MALLNASPLSATGIARGCGWQHIGAYVNLGAYYLVGLPSAALLCFRFHLRGKGLWIGVLTGSIVQATLLALVTASTNWKQQVLIQISLFISLISGPPFLFWMAC